MRFYCQSRSGIHRRAYLSRNIASGRPDTNDLAVAAGFGKQAADSISQDSSGTLTFKGSYPFKMKGYDPANPNPFSIYPLITTTESCIRCGLCADQCPWGAIDPVDFAGIDTEACLRCFRCIKVCPSRAKLLRMRSSWLLYPDLRRD
jgi:ferredoxin